MRRFHFTKGAKEDQLWELATTLKCLNTRWQFDTEHYCFVDALLQSINLFTNRYAVTVVV